MPGASDAAPQGPVSVQLAPAFLDEMSSCAADTRAPADLIAKAGPGVINAKGDCEFPAIGVSCHYHTGSEFVETTTTANTAGRGELHCIFPSKDAQSPRVFGGHVMCKREGQGLPGPTASHAVHEGAACSAEILTQISTCQQFRCCDDGTLTNPIADLVQGGRNDVRPDFRICSAPIAIDCELLSNLTPHSANSPALGGVGAPVFDASGASGAAH